MSSSDIGENKYEMKALETTKPSFKAMVEDEGARVLADAEDTSPITDAERKQVIRKADTRIMPIIWFIFGLQYADKSVTGIAALFGIIQDLKLYTVVSLHPQVLSTKRFSNTLMIFFIGYIIGALPLGYIAQRFPVAKICSVYVLLWGITAILTPACRSYSGIMVQRFFLGFLEGGVSAPLLSIIGAWYTKQEQGFRAPLMNSSPGFFSIMFYALVYGVVLIGNPAHAWRNIYYFVGGATIIMAPITWFLLPDNQRTARFLTARQKYVAVERLRSNHSVTQAHLLHWGQVRETLTDVKVWLLFASTFLVSAPTGAISSFAPLVINKGYGATGRQSLLLLMIIGAVTGVVPLLSGLGAYYLKNGRVFIILGTSAVTFAGLLMCRLAPTSDKQTLLAGLTLVGFYTGPYSLFLSLAISNVSGATKRTTVTAGVYIFSSLQGVAAPFYFVTGAPRYHKGFLITVVEVGVGMCCVAVYGLLAYWENLRRDKLGDEMDHAFEDLTDKQNKGFRYNI